MKDSSTISVLKCVAVDDEPYALEIIRSFCARVSDVELVCFNSSLAARDYLLEHTPDILFLDIVMPDLSGLEIAKLVHQLPYIIFTTAHKQYALESYDYNTVDYLMKPYDFERFSKSLDKARTLLSLKKQKDDEVITIMVEYQKVPVRVGDILYVESVGNYVRLVTSERVYMTQMSIKSIMKILPTDRFVRVHRSFVVSLLAVVSYTRTSLMIGDKQIPIGRAYGFLPHSR